MSVEPDLDPRVADRMLKRAVHLEKRAGRAGKGSNERRKCLARAQYLRAVAQEIFDRLARAAKELVS